MVIFSIKCLFLHDKQGIYYKKIKFKKFMNNIFQNFINLKFKKSFWILFLVLYFFFSFMSFAREKSVDRNKNYLISQSMKFGKDPLKNIFFSADDQHVIVLSANSSLEIIRKPTHFRWPRRGLHRKL